MRTNSFIPNIPLLICSLLFILVGIIAIATASPPFAINNGLDSFYYLNHQLLHGFLPGIILGALAFLIPLNFFKKYSFCFFAISCVLMFAVLIPGVGIYEGGASRWINLLGFSFQPAEFLKITMIIFLAALFSSEKNKKPVLSFIIIVIVTAIAFYIQKDLGTFLIVFASAFTIFFSTNVKLKDVFLSALIGSSLIIFFLAVAPYRMERVMTFLNPSKDTLGDAYQINQSLISIGSGGLSGSGLGLSAQKFGFVPESMSDSIFTIYAEELGFLGCAFLISLLIFFTIYIMQMAKKANPFGKLLTVGICTWIVLQSVINMAAMADMVPLTGIPLPFLSYGGTHLFVELIALGLLLNISRPVNNNNI